MGDEPYSPISFDLEGFAALCEEVCAASVEIDADMRRVLEVKGKEEGCAESADEGVVENDGIPCPLCAEKLSALSVKETELLSAQQESAFLKRQLTRLEESLASLQSKSRQATERSTSLEAELCKLKQEKPRRELQELSVCIFYGIKPVVAWNEENINTFKLCMC